MMWLAGGSRTFPRLSQLMLLFLFSNVCFSSAYVDDDVTSGTGADDEAQELFRRGSGQHTDNWAVLVCTSRFWFNYRHISNTLAIYRSVKRLGMPDSHIILMLADDMACNPRNSEPGTVYTDDRRGALADLYGNDIEVDYKGYEVTVESFTRVLTGRHPEGTPPSKRLQTTERSNILIYMTGHGGNEFLKFQDAEEISSRDIADSFAQMWQKRRYNEIFFVADTCQAGTLATHIYSPQILAVGSSSKDENSYSYGHNDMLGVSMADRFTFSVLRTLEGVTIGSSVRLFKDMLYTEAMSPSFLLSNAQVITRLWKHRPVDDILVTDFFGATVTVETGASPYPLNNSLGASASLPEEEVVEEDEGGGDVDAAWGRQWEDAMALHVVKLKSTHEIYVYGWECSWVVTALVWYGFLVFVIDAIS